MWTSKTACGCIQKDCIFHCGLLRLSETEPSMAGWLCPMEPLEAGHIPGPREQAIPNRGWTEA